MNNIYPTTIIASSREKITLPHSTAVKVPSYKEEHKKKLKHYSGGFCNRPKKRTALILRDNTQKFKTLALSRLT